MKFFYKTYHIKEIVKRYSLIVPYAFHTISITKFKLKYLSNLYFLLKIR